MAFGGGGDVGLKVWRFKVFFKSVSLTSSSTCCFVVSMWASIQAWSFRGKTLQQKQMQYQVLLSAESCDLNCVRRRSEKRLRKTIRTLRKSINREQFHLHFAGSDYELSKNPEPPADLAGHCVGGQVLMGRKCGEFITAFWLHHFCWLFFSSHY